MLEPSVERMYIPHQPGLDGITVYWQNYEPGKGMVTIVCYGCAWNSYFGAMPENTIQEFFAKADVSYLVGRLGSTQFLKTNTTHLKYLARIIEAVKEALKAKEPQ